MADIKISQLGSAIAVEDSDIVPVVSGGNTLKATAAQLKEHAIGNTSISGIGNGSVTGAINALNTDKQPKTLAAAITVDGTEQTTVEGALGAINTDLGSTKQALTTADQRITDTQAIIAPVESGTNYSKTYVQYERFCRDNKLYEVIPVSVGTTDAILIGNNCKQVVDVENYEFWFSTDWGIPIIVTKNDRVCVLTGSYNLTTVALTAHTAYTIGQLKESLRPTHNSYFSVVITDYNGYFKAYARLSIAQNGIVSIATSADIPSGSYLFFNVTYISQ